MIHFSTSLFIVGVAVYIYDLWLPEKKKKKKNRKISLTCSSANVQPSFRKTSIFLITWFTRTQKGAIKDGVVLESRCTDEEIIAVKWIFLTASIQRAAPEREESLVDSISYIFHESMLVQGAVTACARVSMRFDSSVVQNPTKWRNNGLMRPRRRDFTLPLVIHGGDCHYIYRPTHSAALNSSGGRRVVHVPGTRPDEFFSPLFPLFGLFNSGKRSRSRRRGPSYRVWWWWGPASGRWLPISSARWTSSQQFLFSPSYSTVLFISLCPVGGSSTIRRRLLRSHRILNHTVFIERQVLIENLFLCVCVLSEKEREPFTFFELYLYQYKAQRHSP